MNHCGSIVCRDGVLPINKPAGSTSHNVVLQVRKILKIKKIGHAGTLDPYVTGVLLLCIGKATRIVEFLVEFVKEYRTVLKLGITTDTQDFTGRVLSEKPVTVSDEELKEKVQSFVGEIEQIPPMFSAIKIQGQRLYQLARQGQKISRTPRKVRVYDIQILEVNFPFVGLQIKCSQGTYVRTLVSDLGERLGCGACVWELRRTGVGPFGLENTLSLEMLKTLSPIQVAEKYLIPIDKALTNMPALYFDERESRLLSQGVVIKLGQSSQLIDSSTSQFSDLWKNIKISQGYCRGYNIAGNFFAVVKLISDSERGWLVQPIKVIYPQGSYF